MMTNDTSDWGPYDELGRMIVQKPYHQPPTGLARKIMARLEPKRPGWGARIWMRMVEPFTVSLTPLAASATALFLIFIGGYFSSALFSGPTIPTGVNAVDSNVPVLFRFRSTGARSVAVIGTFNRWDPKGYEMVQDAETGNWSLKVDLAPGKHDYVFLVNGKEIAADPHADASRSDGYGHRNSILFVKGKNGQNKI